METYDPHKSTVEARGGDRQKTNSRALIIGLVAIIIAFALIYLWFAVFNHGTPMNNGY